jgi:2-hydroxy fatty acid dioxygenase
VAGTALAVFYVCVTAYANYLRTQDVVTLNWTCGILHTLCWIVQFIGHGAYEGRAPALLDNIFQAIVLAPLFVWLEGLFMFGYRPELQKRVNEAVEKELARNKAEKAQEAHKSK